MSNNCSYYIGAYLVIKTIRHKVKSPYVSCGVEAHGSRRRNVDIETFCSMCGQIQKRMPDIMEHPYLHEIIDLDNDDLAEIGNPSDSRNGTIYVRSNVGNFRWLNLDAKHPDYDEKASDLPTQSDITNHQIEFLKRHYDKIQEIRNHKLVESALVTYGFIVDAEL